MKSLLTTNHRLAGITFYAESRQHYAGYILHNGHFRYYDGILLLIQFLRGIMEKI